VKYYVGIAMEYVIGEKHTISTTGEKYYHL